MYLITGAAGKSGGVSRFVVEMLLDKGQSVRAMVHREDARAQRLRDLGAEVVVGDLTNPRNVVDAMTGVERMFFNMSVSLDYLEATAIVCAAARELGDYEAIVNMSQMTVSEMTLTSTGESHQQWLHWLSEQVINWSGVPAVHVRPTVFLDNPLFTLLARRSVHDRGVLPLPFGTGHTSPIPAADVARVIVAVLCNPADRIGNVYELTGPEVLDINGVAEQYARALQRPVTAEDTPYDQWIRLHLRTSGLPEHVQQHIATMARLHHEDRYNRVSDDVEKLTGEPAQTVEQYVSAHPYLFGGEPGEPHD
jgi:uncharacterized protein YbjT (DUF2867 family)